jgi:RNA polymerase sigma-70 factor (ECF subfamily)
LAELPPRPRDVLHSIAIEGQTAQEVAARLQVSIRTVESDLKLALGHCADSLDLKLYRRLGGPRLRS